MPLYKYRCLKCDEKFEKLVPYAQSDDIECPNCGSKQKRNLSQHLLQFV